MASIIIPVQHARLAREPGMPKENIFISENGQT